ncbi:MAG: Fic family protein [Nanoarchaeota archaeon]|nr:Fic family protein [Nanoarchaeota archaeon]
MELTYDKLIKFDLIENFQEKLMSEKNFSGFSEFFSIIQEIQSTDQFIKDSPSYPGSTNKIIRGELISAIGATLAIEGSTIQREEIEESFRKADLNEKLERIEQEAENSRKVYQFIIDMCCEKKDNFIYNEQMIKQIHKYFTEDINYLSNRPGDYRDFIVSFGIPRMDGLCRTRTEIEKAMKNFINWLNSDRNEISIFNDPQIKAILAHYYLSEIHPFADGNGRTARALEALILFVNGINNYCFWSLANFWSLHRNEYLIHLRNIRLTCDPWEFLLWGMKGYLAEIKRVKYLVLKKVKQLMFMDYIKYLLANKKTEEVKINQRIVDILNILVKSGKIPMDKLNSSPTIKAMYRNSSPSTKYKDIRKMVKKGLIFLSEEENGKVYIEANLEILNFVVYIYNPLNMLTIHGIFTDS